MPNFLSTAQAAIFGTRTCLQCREVKPITDFYVTHDNRLGEKRYNPKCKPCYKEWHNNNRRKARKDPVRREKINARKREYHKNKTQNDKRYKEKYSLASRINKLRRKYGISLSDYEAILKSQNYSCAICKQPWTEEKRKSMSNGCMPIDHDHKNGNVRGILCSACNTIIGMAEDDPIRLRTAAAYIEQYANKAKQMDDKFISTSEAARRLGVSRQWLQARCQEGVAGVHKVGRAYAIPETALPALAAYIQDAPHSPGRPFGGRGQKRTRRPIA